MSATRYVFSDVLTSEPNLSTDGDENNVKERSRATVEGWGTWTTDGWTDGRTKKSLHVSCVELVVEELRARFERDTRDPRPPCLFAGLLA